MCHTLSTAGSQYVCHTLSTAGSQSGECGSIESRQLLASGCQKSILPQAGSFQTSIPAIFKATPFSEFTPDTPSPYTLHPTPYTLHPSPYTLHPTPYALHPTGVAPDMKIRGLLHIINHQLQLVRLIQPFHHLRAAPLPHTICLVHSFAVSYNLRCKVWRLGFKAYEWGFTVDG